MIRLLLPTCIAFLTSGLAGCDEEGPPRGTTPAAPAAAEATAATSWLGPGEETPPARWLVHQVTGKAPAVDAAGAVAVLLDSAAARYRESPRMIANRAVQLQAMLAERGIDEDAIALVELLSRLPAKGRVSFSADCQHYFNLRTQGMDRDRALARLSVTP